MTSRKRITAALIGLIALVVIGWFVREATTAREEQPRPQSAAVFAPSPPEAATTWSIAGEPQFPDSVVDFHG